MININHGKQKLKDSTSHLIAYIMMCLHHFKYAYGSSNLPPTFHKQQFIPWDSPATALKIRHEAASLNLPHMQTHSYGCMPPPNFFLLFYSV